MSGGDLNDDELDESVKIDPELFTESLSVLHQLREQIPKGRADFDALIVDLEKFYKSFCESVNAHTRSGALFVPDAGVIEKVCTLLIPALEEGTTDDIQIECSKTLLPKLKLIQGMLYDPEQVLH